MGDIRKNYYSGHPLSTLLCEMYGVYKKQQQQQNNGTSIGCVCMCVCVFDN